MVVFCYSTRILLTCRCWSDTSTGQDENIKRLRNAKRLAARHVTLDHGVHHSHLARVDSFHSCLLQGNNSVNKVKNWITCRNNWKSMNFFELLFHLNNEKRNSRFPVYRMFCTFQFSKNDTTHAHIPCKGLAARWPIGERLTPDTPKP